MSQVARICDVCGKKPVSGNAVSHSQRHTHRLRLPNIQHVRAFLNGKTVKMNVCTRCIKSRRVTKAA